MAKKAAPRAKPKPVADAPPKRLLVKKGQRFLKSIDSCDKFQRRLFRRSSYEVAERAMTLKLGMFDKRQVEENRDEDGTRIIAAVKNMQKEVKAVGRHIPLSFWSNLISRHKLVGSIHDSLEAPTDQEPVSPKLDAAVKAAHNPNPAVRSAAPLMRILAYKEDCFRTEFYGLVKACFESPSMSKPMSKLLLTGLLAWIGRLRLDRQFEDYWNVLSSLFDKQLCDSWARACTELVTRANWLRAHRA